MGIPRHGAQSFLFEGMRKPFGGSVLQLGRQDIFFTLEEFDAWAAARGYPLNRLREPTFRPVDPAPGIRWIDDVTFFSRLGFDEVRSCDAAEIDKPDFVFDLSANVPSELQDRFDLVFDGGTLEHIFDVPRALANIRSLLKVGGRIVHSSPMSNLVDHGFYSFSPGLFWDYYVANGFEVDACFIVAHQIQHTSNSAFAESAFFKYTLGCLDQCENAFVAETFGKYNVFMLFFVATKRAESAGNVIPFQSRYLRMWNTPGQAPRPAQGLPFMGIF